MNRTQDHTQGRPRACRQGRLYALVCAVSCVLCCQQAARAEIVTLKNGMQFEGSVGKIASLGDDPVVAKVNAGAPNPQLILLVDDELRRTFFPTREVRTSVPKQTHLERIKIEQRVARGTRRVSTVGPFTVTPFDDYGRRIVQMQTTKGPVQIIQGITEITPTYTKVEGLQARNAYAWDMRIDTNSIPRETLSKILLRQIDPQNADDRLRLVRLYIQAERYKDAQQELQSAIKAFPALANLENQVKSLHQSTARLLIKEIQLRKEAGQHRLALEALSGFPAKGVASELLLQIRDTLDEYNGLKAKGEGALQRLGQHFDNLKSPESKKEVAPIIAEIKAELNITTLDRMADFLRLADDKNMTDEQKVALAVSGWLLGSGSGTDNLAVALSLWKLRAFVVRYLNSERDNERTQILQDLQSLAGGSPANLAKLIARMKPPVATAAPEGGPPGWYELAVPGLTQEPDIKYSVQLPPEYDPYRRYPCVVTLNGAGSTPALQIDWWAGPLHEEKRLRQGQTMRHGFVVVAPHWTKPHQNQYEFSAREHAAVLYSLRDVCRRFSIDTDRVFLSGHSIGGDAAWDIGLAHPDLWAGVIPIVATVDKYITRYWENGRNVPFYFVSGELDGDKKSKNKMDWERYLTKHTYDVIIVEYRGRGHEHFQDEIHRLFEWMKLHRRNFFPKEFICDTMRPWDNFFWWAELSDMPSTSMVVPVNWPPDAGVRAARSEGKIFEANRVTLRTGAKQVRVWLSPEMVDFTRRITILVNGPSRTKLVEPQSSVLLEDVRSRGDRQHPFWAYVE